MSRMVFVEERNRLMKRIAYLVVAIVMLAGLAGAQEARCTIQGTVKDPQGGLVANASVVITNTDTKTTEIGRAHV